MNCKYVLVWLAALADRTGMHVVAHGRGSMVPPYICTGLCCLPPEPLIEAPLSG